jgi:hypothetical protein
MMRLRRCHTDARQAPCIGRQALGNEDPAVRARSLPWPAKLIDARTRAGPNQPEVASCMGTGLAANATKD